MNPATILELLQYAPTFLKLIPAVQSAYNSSTGSTTAKVTGVIQSIAPALMPALEQAGATMFPNLAPEIHAAAAIMSGFHPDATQWLQDALNHLMTRAEINAAIQTIASGSPANALAVDGQYGPRTIAVFKAWQAKNGFALTGFADDAEQATLQYLLSKL